jgi:ribosomal protein L3 glutamine methyltransferase
MDLIRRLLADASRQLAPQGVLVLEIGHERTHFEAAFPNLPVVWLATSSGDDAVLLIEAATLRRAT